MRALCIIIALSIAGVEPVFGQFTHEFDDYKVFKINESIPVGTILARGRKSNETLGQVGLSASDTIHNEASYVIRKGRLKATTKKSKNSFDSKLKSIAINHKTSIKQGPLNLLDCVSLLNERDADRIFYQKSMFRKRPRIVYETVAIQGGSMDYITLDTVHWKSEIEKDTTWLHYKIKQEIDKQTYRAIITDPVPLFYKERKVNGLLYREIKDKFLSEKRFARVDLFSSATVQLAPQKPETLRVISPLLFSLGIRYNFPLPNYSVFGMGFTYFVPYEVTTINSFATFRADYPGSVENTYQMQTININLRYNFISHRAYLANATRKVEPFVDCIFNYNKKAIRKVSSDLLQPDSEDVLKNISIDDPAWDVGGGFGVRIVFNRLLSLELETQLIPANIKGEDYQFTLFGSASSTPTENRIMLNRNSLALQFNLLK